MRDRAQRAGFVGVGAAAVLLLSAASAPAQNAISASRVLVHLDGVMFGPPNLALEGGGVYVDMGSPGKSAGLQATGGGSVGVEVRVTKIAWLDASVGYFRPHLYTATYVDSETPIAGRTDTVTVVPVTLGLNFRFLRQSLGPVSFAFGPQAVRFGLQGIPADAGISVDSGKWGFGLHGRLDAAVGRHWIALDGPAVRGGARLQGPLDRSDEGPAVLGDVPQARRRTALLRVRLRPVACPMSWAGRLPGV